jgi:hypothetical protein
MSKWRSLGIIVLASVCGAAYTGGKRKSSEPARAGCARDLRSCQATLARIVQSIVRRSIMDTRVMRGW